MKLSENFSISEFTCKDGTPVPPEYYDNVRELAQNLQVLRDYLNAPITINSGYRSPHYNDFIVKGAKKSQHKYATAADIVVKGHTPEQVAQAIEELIAQGRMKNGGLGRYWGFTHYDVRPTPARWDNRN